MEKDIFIEKLQDNNISVSENEQDFKTLDNNVFEKFIPDLVNIDIHQHRWNLSYFNSKIRELKNAFNREFIQHILEVKKYLQQEKMQDKVIDTTISEPMITKENEIVKEEILEPQVVNQDKIDNSTKPDLSLFKPENKLLELIQKNDDIAVKNYLMSLLNNRRKKLEDVVLSIWYVYDNKPSVFEDFEINAFAEDFSKNEADWNMDYFSLQQVYLNMNFSLQRLLHLFNVRETLSTKDPDFAQIHINKKAKINSIPKDFKEQSVRSENISDVNKSTHNATESKQSCRAENNEQSNESNSNSPDSKQSFLKIALLVGGIVFTVIAGLIIFK